MHVFIHAIFITIINSIIMKEKEKENYLKHRLGITKITVKPSL